MKQSKNLFVGLSREFLWKSNQKRRKLQSIVGEGPQHVINQTEKLMAHQVKSPFVGAVVILHLGENDPIQNNGSKEMPAFITRVWSKDPPFMVNLKGIPDGPGTIWRTSIMHQNPYDGVVIAQNPGWRWPDEELERGEALMAAAD